MRCWTRSTGVLLLLLPLAASAASAAAPVVRYVDFEAMVNPITARRITLAIDDAERERDALVLIRLDTPGGLVTSTESIIKRILAAEVPVAVWVGPAGAHAASAGFFILISADVAAMAPGTRTGAASTVTLGGENREGDVLLKKMNEDMAALLRSIAERRGRNAETGERAVFEAAAFTETVALAEGLIDLIADDRDDLIARLDGREIRRFDRSTTVLDLAGATFVESRFSLKHEFMEVLALPYVAYLLLMGGLLGLYIEFTQPGVVFPGVVGALCLLLFAISAQALPVSAIGVLLILLAIVMFLLEIKVPSFGMLSVGGIVSLLIGSWMLIDGPIPEMRLPWQLYVPTSLIIAGFCLLAVWLVVRAHRSRVRTGCEGLIGEIGTVTDPLTPDGRIFVEGAVWNATTSAVAPLPPGARVRVVRIDLDDMMRLHVEPLTPHAADRS